MNQLFKGFEIRSDLSRFIANYLGILSIESIFSGNKITVPQTQVSPGYRQLQPLFALAQSLFRPLLFGYIPLGPEYPQRFAVVIPFGDPPD